MQLMGWQLVLTILSRLLVCGRRCGGCGLAWGLALAHNVFTGANVKQQNKCLSLKMVENEFHSDACGLLQCWKNIGVHATLAYVRLHLPQLLQLRHNVPSFPFLQHELRHCSSCILRIVYLPSSVTGGISTWHNKTNEGLFISWVISTNFEEAALS